MKIKEKSDKPAKINSSIFEPFNKLTSEDEGIRIKGAHSLLRVIEDSESEREQKYALKRLIRGVGSSSSSSRVGYYSAFCGFLSNVENPPTITEILELVGKELYAEAEDKAKLDTQVGTILVCGAVIRSKVFNSASGEEVDGITKHLVTCLKKNNIQSLACTFLNEMVDKVNSKVFKKHLWPQVEDLLKVPKSRNTLDTVFFLLLASKHHPNVVGPKFFEETWNSSSILKASNFEFLANLLWNIKNTCSINHPFYAFFVKQLVEAKQLGVFWKCVEKIVVSNLKFKDIVTLHFAITVMKNIVEMPSEVNDLLTKNFIAMLVQNSKIFGKLSEDVQELYTEFFELLNKHFQASNNNEQKRKWLDLILKNPGAILLEKPQSNKFVSNLINSLSIPDLKNTAETLKNIIAAEKETSMPERIYAAQILQKILINKLVANDIDWRVKQLKFFVNFAIFKSNDGVNLVQDADLDVTVAKELTPSLKGIFFHCLEHKFSKLEDERKQLFTLVEYINEILAKKHPNKHLNRHLKDSQLSVWKKMFEQTSLPIKKNKNQLTVFHVLLLHMGLQLFNQAEVAESALNELQSVIKRVSASKKDVSDEPEWIEVVVDLFLNLLSQNSVVLRNVIRHVYPQLCGELSLTAFHQILTLLDLSSAENPLQAAAEIESEEEEDESEIDSNEDEEEDTTTNGDISELDDASDEGSDYDMEDEEEEETVTDKFRLAIRSALTGNGNETDAESVDMDDMDAEEGERLDSALADAFRLLQQNKKTKKVTRKDKMAEEALVHFRMRVLDLVDIYLKNNPKLVICLEIVMFVFDLLPLAIKEAKHKEILGRFNNIFDKLVQIPKSFTEDSIAEVSQQDVADNFTSLLEKTLKDQSFPQKLNFVTRACQFLINSSHHLQKLRPVDAPLVPDMMQSNLGEFLAQRNPVLQLNTYQVIFASQWSGNWQMGKFLADKGLKMEIRSLRRTQSLQLLKVLYKNTRLISLNIEQNGKQLQKIERHLTEYVEQLKEAAEVSPNEFHELLQVLIVIHHLYKQMSKQLNKSAMKWQNIGENVQTIRQKLVLKVNIQDNYKKLCNALKLTPLQNSDNAQKPKINGINGSNANTTNGKRDKKDKKETEMNGVESDSSKPVNGLKRKTTDYKKEKKLKKQKRLEEASKGFNASFSFANAQQMEVD